MSLVNSMLLRGMNRVKEIKPIDFFQPIINQSPYAVVLFVDFTHPVNSSTTGPV